MTWASVVDVLYASVAATAGQLLVVLGPLAACAIVLHQLERITQSLLISTFGVRAALVTGWLGVPVHEISHVVSCLVFMHEIEEVQLFSPNEADGTLGFVRHRAPAGNPWAEVGRFFIGVAPLVGGALALLAVAKLLLPADALELVTRLDLRATPDAATAAWRGLSRGAEAAASLVAPRHFVEPKLWLFSYLTACIGCHLAPSRADLRGAARGALALVGVLFAVNAVARFAGVGVDPRAPLYVAAWTTPIVALLVFATLLSAALFALVLVVTLVVDRLRGATEGQLARFARDHALRLVLVAIGCAAFARAAGVLG